MTRQFEPHINLWVEREGQVALSGWRVALLEAIAATGSITGAAERMEVPYRVAWSKIKEMEQALELSLIETRVGGPDGGGARLTSAAEEYIRRYHELAAGIEEWVERRFAQVFDPNRS
jgi:molybdate transport system regulatory protein